MVGKADRCKEYTGLCLFIPDSRWLLDEPKHDVANPDLVSGP